MPKFTLDGKEIEFKDGQTIIEAAKDQGIDIPHFCWHPELSVSGNCRMCLVEVEKMPKLVIACATNAADGMVVNVNSQRALDARQAVMEFILINHPLDCPICDEAGECKLQDYTYQHSIGESRFVEEKVSKGKRTLLGPHVMFDGERCISCSRCIRFCDEIAGQNQITFVQRGDRVTIEPYPGKQMDNPYSLCTTDICPVGALTNVDFRFKARVWDMSSTKSVCQGCARGCNIEIWVRNNEILRLTPRYNGDVNSHWMCDDGRLNTFKFVNEDNRIDGPKIRKDGELVSTGWDEVFALTASELKTFNKDEIAFVGSAFATCEDNYILVKFAKQLGIKNIGFPEHVITGSGDDILIREDKTPNAQGASLVGVKPAKGGYSFEGIINGMRSGKIKALYVIDEDIAALNTEYEELLSKLNLLIVHSSNLNKTTALADIIFPSAVYAEKNGSIVNFQGRVQRIRPAVTTVDMDRSLDGMTMSRLDKFGTKFDKWSSRKKVDARSGWKIISVLANTLGGKMKYQMAEDVFNEIANSVDEFKGLDYDVIGDLGAMLSLKETQQAVKV